MENYVKIDNEKIEKIIRKIFKLRILDKIKIRIILIKIMEILESNFYIKLKKIKI